MKFKAWMTPYICGAAVSLFAYGLILFLNWRYEGTSPFENWSVSSPGVLTWSTTGYRIETADAERYIVTGPNGYSSTCYTLSACKYRAHMNRKARRDVGLE